MIKSAIYGGLIGVALAVAIMLVVFAIVSFALWQIAYPDWISVRLVIGIFGLLGSIAGAGSHD